MGDLVSIVIPVYNTEEYVAEAVQSALDQSYGDCEVVVVDDGSADGTADVLEGFSGAATVVRKGNGGTASALNAGIERMSGEWFCWLSADDRLHGNAVRDLMAAVARTVGARDCIFYGDLDFIDGSGNVTGRYTAPDAPHTPYWQNAKLISNFYGGGGIIHKSAFGRHGRFDESLRLCEDYEMWLRLCVLHGFRLVRVPSVLQSKRMHDRQLSVSASAGIPDAERGIKLDLLKRMGSADADRYGRHIRRATAGPTERRLRRRLRRVVRALRVVREPPPDKCGAACGGRPCAICSV